jgi:hypothetical protein
MRTFLPRAALGVWLAVGAWSGCSGGPAGDDPQASGKEDQKIMDHYQDAMPGDIGVGRVIYPAKPIAGPDGTVMDDGLWPVDKLVIQDRGTVCKAEGQGREFLTFKPPFRVTRKQSRRCVTDGLFGTPAEQSTPDGGSDANLDFDEFNIEQGTPEGWTAPAPQPAAGDTQGNAGNVLQGETGPTQFRGAVVTDSADGPLVNITPCTFPGHRSFLKFDNRFERRDGGETTCSWNPNIHIPLVVMVPLPRD